MAGSQTTATTPGRAVPGAGAHRLFVLYAPSSSGTGTSVALGTGAATIGRDDGEPKALALDDAEVSRAHAVVEPDGEAWRIRDLGSRNGTFVQGERVNECALQDGSVIRVGSHVVLFDFVSFADAQQLATGPRAEGWSLVGETFAIRRVRASIEEVARSDGPVLIQGESGVGKELVARELHERSERSGKLVPVNCAALPDNLVESELFGHAKGAFTGATSASQGLFGQAEGGTLFLDEIGAMPLAMQAKLLRALATGEVRAVGDAEARNVDVRVVAATNVDLEKAVEEGAFRGDLYARLMGSTIRIPPLRERRDDVLPLARYFLKEQGKPRKLEPDAAEALLCHHWPFNVRELEQTVRAVPPSASQADRLDLDHLPDDLRAPIAARSTATPPREIPIALRVPPTSTPTGPQLAEVLEHFEGNVSKVAEFFGKDRKQIYRWAERLGVDTEGFRAAAAPLADRDEGDAGL